MNCCLVRNTLARHFFLVPPSVLVDDSFAVEDDAAAAVSMARYLTRHQAQRKQVGEPGAVTRQDLHKLWTTHVRRITLNADSNPT